MQTPPRKIFFNFSSWNTKTLKLWLKEAYNLEVTKPRIFQILKEEGFSWKKGEHKYVLADEKEQKRFIRKVRRIFKRMKPNQVALFEDECSVKQHPSLTHMWMKTGSVVEVPTYGNHKKKRIFGSVNPLSGEIIVHLTDKLTQHEFIKHLQQIVIRFSNREILLFLDSYPSHTTPLVQKFIQEHLQIKVVWMPKYSPKLNVIESVWKELKNAVGNWFYATIQEMEKAIMKFFRTLWYDKQKVVSIVAFKRKYSI